MKGRSARGVGLALGILVESHLRRSIRWMCSKRREREEMEGAGLMGRGILEKKGMVNEECGNEGSNVESGDVIAVYWKAGGNAE